MIMVPYKSVAAALVLVVLFGPVGVFYSSFLGGVVLSIFGLVSIGTMASMRSPLPMATVWLFGIIWSMAAVRFYNRKMLKIALTGGLSDSKEEKKSFFHKKPTPQAAAPSEPANKASVEEPSDSDEATTSWKL